MAVEIDYQSVLADLLRRREEMDKTIAGICAILNVPVPSGPGPTGNGGGSTRSEGSREIRSDTFFNMKAPEAVKAFLGMAKRPQSVKEIQDALEQGGFITQAKDLYNNLYTAILRMDKDGSVVKVHGKWGLAEWYPARPKPKAKAEGGVEKEETADEEVDAA